MRRLTLCVAAAVVALAVGGQADAAATVIATFDENHYPTNPMNGFGAFTFGDFVQPGAFTDGPNSLILDVVDSDQLNGVAGGVGVDYGPFDFTLGLSPIDFDPAFAFWELRVRILENNRASAVRTLIHDVDVSGTEEHIWEFDLTGVPDDGNFHSLFVPFPDLLFTQSLADGILNPGLNQIRVESVFGSSERLNIEIDHASMWATVPEPASLSLLGLGYLGCLLAMRRRRSCFLQGRPVLTMPSCRRMDSC
jgi:PEP-CTERM motif